MLCPLQRRYHAPQGLNLEAPSDFNPAPASQNDRQLGSIPALRRHLDSNPPRHLFLTLLLPTISSQVPNQRFQRHAPLFAELPLAEPARFTFGRQPVGFFTSPPPP
jgi:hypothetical protein